MNNMITIDEVIKHVDDRMDMLMGRGEYHIDNHDDTKIYVTFNDPNFVFINLGKDVANYVNRQFEKDIVYVSNYTTKLFILIFE